VFGAGHDYLKTLKKSIKNESNSIQHYCLKRSGNDNSSYSLVLISMIVPVLQILQLLMQPIVYPDMKPPVWAKLLRVKLQDIPPFI